MTAKEYCTQGLWCGVELKNTEYSFYTVVELALHGKMALVSSAGRHKAYCTEILWNMLPFCMSFIAAFNFWSICLIQVERPKYVSNIFISECLKGYFFLVKTKHNISGQYLSLHILLLFKFLIIGYISNILHCNT